MQQHNACTITARASPHAINNTTTIIVAANTPHTCAGCSQSQQTWQWGQQRQTLRCVGCCTSNCDDAGCVLVRVNAVGGGWGRVQGAFSLQLGWDEGSGGRQGTTRLQQPHLGGRGGSNVCATTAPTRCWVRWAEGWTSGREGLVDKRTRS